MSRLARAEVELENLLGIKRVRNYPPERPILRGDVRAQAEHNAIELRERLGLGNAPIGDIVTLLEMEMGVRVYVRRFDGRISGLFAYDDELGPCILLNANHPRERRTQTAAHESGHFLSTRRQPEVLHTDEMTNSREERYADAFGRAFLTPPRAVMQKFQEITAGSDRLTRRHVIVLAHFFGVSREAMVRRLEELGLVKKDTWDWFQANGSITDQHARQVLGDLATPDAQKADADRPTTLRLNLLAAEAYRRELLSEGQLARLLDIDRIELREIMDGLEIEGSEADAAPHFPELIRMQFSSLIPARPSISMRQAARGRFFEPSRTDWWSPRRFLSSWKPASNEAAEDADYLKELINDGFVEVITMGDVGIRHFEELVIGPATEYPR